MHVTKIAGRQTLFVFTTCKSDAVLKGHNDIERVIADRETYEKYADSIKPALTKDAKIIFIPLESK